MAGSTATLRRRLSADITAPRLEKAQESFEDLRRRYSRDPFAHCEDGHVVIEDIETGELALLVPTPQQRKLTEDWIDLPHLKRTGRLRWRNVHLRKSRQLGMTWWVAYLFLWALTWHPQALLAVFPTIGDAADSGFTTDSFLGRVKFMLEYGLGEGEDLGGFPSWLRPDLAFTGGNDPLIRNVHSGAFLAAEGGIATPGRGKKYKACFLDEFAFHPFGKSAHKALTRAVPTGRLYNSTPFGEDNTYAWLLKVRPAGYRFLRMHWSEHPFYGRGRHIAGAKRSCELCAGNRRGDRWNANAPTCHRYPGKLTSPWFDQAVVEMTDEDVASELEIDFTASLTARVYPEFSDFHVAAEPIPWFKELHNDTCISFDYGVAVTAVTISQDAPHEWRMIGEVEVEDADPDIVAAAIKQELHRLGMPWEFLTPEWTSTILCVGDIAGQQRQGPTARPLVAEYRRHGFVIQSKWVDVASSIRATKRLFLGRPKPFVVSPTCENFIRHAKHNRWPVDRLGNRKPDAPAPENNEHNHIMRSFAYLVSWKYPALGRPGDVLMPEPGRRDRELSARELTGKLDPDVTPGMAL